MPQVAFPQESFLGGRISGQGNKSWGRGKVAFIPPQGNEAPYTVPVDIAISPDHEAPYFSICNNAYICAILVTP